MDDGTYTNAPQRELSGSTRHSDLRSPIGVRTHQLPSGIARTLTAAAAPRRSPGRARGLWVCAMLALASACSAEAEPDPASSEDHTCAPDCGPPIETFFEPERVASLDLQFGPEVTQALGYEPEQWRDLLWSKWDHCGPYTNYVPVTMTYTSPDGVDAEVLEDVGVRFRGSRGIGDARPGFKLAMHALLPEPPDGQPRRRFADLNRLNLLSLEGDESVMLQCVAYRMLREFDLPAPRCNHIAVSVNGEYYGLMENVEEPDDGRYLRHRFGDNTGMLIEASHGCGFEDHLADLEYLGPSYADGYQLAYDVIRGELSDAEATLIPLTRCADRDETPDDAEFRQCIAEWIDVDQWLRTIAAESIMPGLEAFVGSRRNYYLYFLADESATHGGHFQVYSWDFDQVFHAQGCFPLGCDLYTAIPAWWAPLGERSPAVLRLTEVYAEQYCATMDSFLNEVFRAETVDETAEAIAEAMMNDPLISHQAWSAEVELMRDHVEWRATSVRAMKESLCGA